MLTAVDLLEQKDWRAVESEYFDSAPYNFAVIDNFFAPETCAFIRDAIVNNKGWSFMNWQAEELFIRNFDLPIVKDVAAAVTERLPRIFDRLALVQHIAFMHQRNNGLCAHSDTGLVTVDVWLTPEEFNLEPESGGLVLYDVKRESDQDIHQFNARPWCVEYFKAHTRGGSVTVPYKYNRAIIFDARTFHASDRMRFVGTGADTYRINYALLFDDPSTFRDRYERYR